MISRLGRITKILKVYAMQSVDVNFLLSESWGHLIQGNNRPKF